MRKITFVLIVSMAVFSLFLQAQTEKKSLGEKEYDTWKEIASPQLSDNGKWLWYGLNPQFGDGEFIIQSTESKQSTRVARGVDPLLFGKEQFMLVKQKVEMDTLRRAKLAKLKEDKLPRDTFSIVRLSDFTVTQYPEAKEFKVSEDGNIAAYTYELKSDTTEKAKKFLRLVVFDVVSGDSVVADSVKSFALSRSGKSFIYTKQADSLCQVFIYPYSVSQRVADTAYMAFSTTFGKVPALTIDEAGEQAAFIASTDTVKHALYTLYYADLKSKKGISTVTIDHLSEKMPQEWSISPFSKLSFTQSGNQLRFDVAPKLKELPKDTLTNDEKFSVDLWSWHDTYLMTQQLANKKRWEEKNYQAVYFPKEKRWLPLADETIETIHFADNDESTYALGIADIHYLHSMTWDMQTPKDLYSIDLKTGDKKIVIQKRIINPYIAPSGSHVLFYDMVDKNWFSVDMKTGKEQNISASIPYPLYNEDNDMPQHPSSYSFVGWNKADGKAWVSDRFDIWALDLTGKSAPVNVTQIGRDLQTQFTLVPIDRERGKHSSINTAGTLLLRSFNRVNMESGFYTLKLGSKPEKRVEGPYAYTFRAEARAGKNMLFTRENYREFRDLWVADKLVTSTERITDANPQQSEYNWGTSQLFEWTDLNGKPAKGILYLPDGYDSTKAYPTIVYFYETHTHDLHRYYPPIPSRSIVFPSICNSNGYVVFMPDITYTTGYPGKSCYDIVVSGSQALIERGIADKARIGLQGQSWGGYQIAYLVTRTDMFRCCSPGAPVSNMLSAYGGIRWESGLARSFQYEHTQSRIGATPWERLDLYLENSPVVHADRVNTPMLIRHSDDDGAVPWYQGIEYFIALRRLGKPVWMLNYNKEPHNLKSRPAMIDWSKRMYQFFDHYLKDAPMPRWMKEGISVTEKGIDQKLELIEQ